MIGQWFWQPDKDYVNAINTTSLRSLTGNRLAVAVVALGMVAFVWAMVHAIPWTLDPCPAMPCLEPLGRARATDFARTIFDSLCLFVGTLLGIAVGGYAVKRNTDTDHRVRVEEAKKAPAPTIIQTSEYPAMQPPPVKQEVNITTNGDVSSPAPDVPPDVQPGKAVEP